MLAEFDYYELRISVSDGSASSANTVQDFRTALRDPEVNLEAFSTNPAEPEESTRAAIQYDLIGDVDMVGVVMMSVDQIDSRPVDVSNAFNHINGTVVGSFQQPKVRDILPAGSPIAPVQMTARLQVEYGFGFSKVFDQQYTLFLDRTPPSIAIVSPDDGDFIALDERTDVLIQAFDKYGIETVEVQKNGGPFEILQDPTRYSFVATVDDIATGIVINARATDPNNNVSNLVTVTLNPYDAEAGAPKVEIISPSDGTTYHEGEAVTFEVLLRNVSDAKLFLDVGGVAAAPETAIDIVKATDGAERQFVTAVMPPVSEDIVVLARIQKGNLKGFKFLNAINDDGVSEQVELTLLPAQRVLTGTSLQILAVPPEAMSDFSDDSEVLITDPLAGGVEQSFLMKQIHRIELNNVDTQIGIETVLRDRSGNESRQSITVNKIPYFDASLANTYLATSLNETIDFYAIAPGFIADSELFVGINNRNGGYRIATASSEIINSSQGSLKFLAYSGTGLIAEIQYEGESSVQFYPLVNGTLGLSSEYSISGNLIAANGNTLWLQYGQLIATTEITNTGLAASAGISINESIIDTQLLGDKLIVLTESGLYRLALNVGTLPKVIQEMFIDLPSQHGFNVSGEDLLTWSENNIFTYQWLADGSLVEPLNNQISLLGTVTDSTNDGNITWLRLEKDLTTDWIAIENDELIGITANPSSFVAVTPTRWYSIDGSGVGDAVVYRNIVTAPITLAPTISMSPEIFGVSISIDGVNDPNLIEVSFSSAGAQLASKTYYQNGELHWFLAYADLSNPQVDVSDRKSVV